MAVGRVDGQGRTDHHVVLFAVALEVGLAASREDVGVLALEDLATPGSSREGSRARGLDELRTAAAAVALPAAAVHCSHRPAVAAEHT